MAALYNQRYRIPSARLEGYDYGQNGAYFVTICTKDRIHYFGEIIENDVAETQNFASLRQTQIAEIANEYWMKIPEHFPFVVLDEFQLMPNHLHGIIIISKPVETQNIPGRNGYKNKFGPQSGNLSSVIRGYKAAVKSFATTNHIDFAWQPRFHDHIIRNEDEMNRIRKYIVENPDNWMRDRNNEKDPFM
ncbi:MAG TPA: hypothetical protein VM368_01995 [Flavisolibacter sp.]|nr:hypothetical protein [Flavisolibacter sp.]